MLSKLVVATEQTKCGKGDRSVFDECLYCPFTPPHQTTPSPVYNSGTCELHPTPRRRCWAQMEELGNALWCTLSHLTLQALSRMGCARFLHSVVESRLDCKLSTGSHGECQSELTKSANSWVPRIPILRGPRERSLLVFSAFSCWRRFQMVCSAFSLQRSKGRTERK